MASYSYVPSLAVRRQAIGFIGLTSGESLSIGNVIEEQQSTELPSGQPLRVNTKPGESRPAGQREMSRSRTSPSLGGQSRERGARMSRSPERMIYTDTRYASPEPLFACDGWCKYSEVSHPNVVSISPSLVRNTMRPHACRQLSLSACSDSQRAWEGPNGSLTVILCNYLSQCILLWKCCIPGSDISH